MMLTEDESEEGGGETVAETEEGGEEGREGETETGWFPSCGSRGGRGCAPAAASAESSLRAPKSRPHAHPSHRQSAPH